MIGWSLFINCADWTQRVIVAFADDELVEIHDDAESISVDDIPGTFSLFADSDPDDDMHFPQHQAVGKGKGKGVGKGKGKAKGKGMGQETGMAIVGKGKGKVKGKDPAGVTFWFVPEAFGKGVGGKGVFEPDDRDL